MPILDATSINEFVSDGRGKLRALPKEKITEAIDKGLDSISGFASGKKIDSDEATENISSLMKFVNNGADFVKKNKTAIKLAASVATVLFLAAHPPGLGVIVISIALPVGFMALKKFANSVDKDTKLGKIISFGKKLFENKAVRNFLKSETFYSVANSINPALGESVKSLQESLQRVDAEKLSATEEAQAVESAPIVSEQSIPVRGSKVAEAAVSQDDKHKVVASSADISQVARIDEGEGIHQQTQKISHDKRSKFFMGAIGRLNTKIDDLNREIDELPDSDHGKITKLRLVAKRTKCFKEMIITESHFSSVSLPIELIFEQINKNLLDQQQQILESITDKEKYKETIKSGNMAISKACSFSADLGIKLG